jgi:hypothetical protein
MKMRILTTALMGGFCLIGAGCTTLTTNGTSQGPGMAPLPGQFAFQARRGFLTAVGGGGRTTDVIHTDASNPKAWEKFRLWFNANSGPYYAIQTVDGHFLTALNNGGQIANAIQSSSTTIVDEALFNLVSEAGAGVSFGAYAIQTVRGYFITAVGGGGKNGGETIHTDARNFGSWEEFNLFRCGDLGSGSTYGIETGAPAGFLNISAWIGAAGGGHSAGPNALVPSDLIPSHLTLTLLRQPDGSYAMQTSSGYFVTANGGGPGQGFRTDAAQIGTQEKFTYVDHGDCTGYLKTYEGNYLSAGANSITTVSDIAKASRWRFWVYRL